MTKRNVARHDGQDPSTTSNNHRTSQSGSPEPPDPELILPGLTHEQWSLVLDPRHRSTALRLALKVPDRLLGIDALLRTAQETLIAAALVYDPARGVPFTAYARHRMRGAMNERAREPQVPERLRTWRQDLIWMVVLSEKDK